MKKFICTALFGLLSISVNAETGKIKGSLNCKFRFKNIYPEGKEYKAEAEINYPGETAAPGASANAQLSLENDFGKLTAKYLHQRYDLVLTSKADPAREVRLVGPQSESTPIMAFLKVPKYTFKGSKEPMELEDIGVQCQVIEFIE